MRVFLILALVFCVPLEGVTTNHRAWVSAWKELSKKGIDKNELALASILEKTLSTDSESANTENEILQSQDPTNPDEVIKAAESAMSDLHRLSSVQSVQQETQECCAAHRIGSLDDLSQQATQVLQRLGAVPLTRVLDHNDEMVLSGKHAQEHAGKRALWQRVMGRGKLHGGKQHGGKAAAAANGGKVMGPDQRKLKLHPVEIEGETVEADTPDDESHYPNGGRGGGMSPQQQSSSDSSQQSSSTDSSSSTQNVSPSVTELKAKIAALIQRIKEHSQSTDGLTKTVAEGKELMKLYKQVKSATEIELLKYTINTADMGPFPVEADDVVDSPLDQNAASWGVSGGIVADWVSPYAAGGAQNEYNANICCNLNGGGSGDIENPGTIPESSTTVASPSTSSTVTPTATPQPVSSSAAVVVTASSSSSTAGSLLQAAATEKSTSNIIPGLGEVHVYRLFPGATTKVNPGDVPGLPNLMTLPADVVPPEGRQVPPINNGPSSDNMMHGVRFEQHNTQAASPATPTVAVSASSPASPPSNIPAGMIAPAIDPSLHLSADQLNAIMGGAAGAGLVHPALSPVPLAQGLVPPTYSDAGALLQQREQQGSSEEVLTADQLWALLKQQEQQRMNPQPTPAPMTPAEMLKVELDMLRKQMH